VSGLRVSGTARRDAFFQTGTGGIRAMKVAYAFHLLAPGTDACDGLGTDVSDLWSVSDLWRVACIIRLVDTATLSMEVARWPVRSINSAAAEVSRALDVFDDFFGLGVDDLALSLPAFLTMILVARSNERGKDSRLRRCRAIRGSMRQCH